MATAAITENRQHMVVIAFNASARKISYNIQVGRSHAPMTIPENSIQTLRFRLAGLE